MPSRHRRRTIPAFSLIELTIVVVILAIIAAVAIPRMTVASSSAKHAQLQRFVHDTKVLIEQTKAMEGEYPATPDVDAWFGNSRTALTPYPGHGTGVKATSETGGKTHPAVKLSGASNEPYWYNPENGAFRVRILDQGSAEANIALYNYLNGSSIADLADRLD